VSNFCLPDLVYICTSVLPVCAHVPGDHVLLDVMLEDHAVGVHVVLEEGGLALQPGGVVAPPLVQLHPSRLHYRGIPPLST
jgi:hypothetical protein